jgi:succinoglycan biosynthesis protein ExoV
VADQRRTDAPADDAGRRVILYRWQGRLTNFGDELNTVLWPQLLPGFFDDNPASRFLGIGSVLDERHPRDALKLVAGSGYGGYQPKPVLDDTWVVHWVRGPRTAAALGMPRSLGLGDPAVLLPGALSLAADRTAGIGFMPHFESAARGAWQHAAALAGITLIDPSGPPLAILAAIARCRVILSEALHGVIVADALRVPWVAMRPLARIHRAKWQDWAETVDVAPRFATLPASTAFEWASASIAGRSHTARGWLTRHEKWLADIASERLLTSAGQALRRAASTEPQLSPDAAVQRCQSRMLDALAALRRSPCPAFVPVGPRRSCLRGADDSAYQLGLTG